MPSGSMSALITPFKNNKIDVETYERLIKRQIRHGMDGCVPAGTTGESATMSHAEHKECIEIAVNTCKGTGIKVLAGAGSNNTIEAIELAQFAQKCGADAILSVAPYYNRPTKEGMYQHFKAIAESVEIPVMLYNVPARTSSDITPDVVGRLLKDTRNIYAIKEASGLIERSMGLYNLHFNLLDSSFKILSGDDMLNYPILSYGGSGVISVTGNLLPQDIANLTHLALSGEYEKARDISNKLYEINKILFIESNPIMIKAAMYLKGLTPTLEYRLPLCKPSSENLKILENTLEKYEVKQ